MREARLSGDAGSRRGSAEMRAVVSGESLERARKRLFGELLRGAVQYVTDRSALARRRALAGGRAEGTPAGSSPGGGLGPAEAEDPAAAHEAQAYGRLGPVPETSPVVLSTPADGSQATPKASDPRFGPDVQWSDRAVRERLKAASIDSLLMTMRLRSCGQPLPWVKLVAADCEFLRRQGLVPPAMPGFFDAPLQWAELVADRQKWADIVGSVHVCDSCLDRDCTASSATPLTVKCRMCSARFASARARACHERIAHRMTTKAKCYLHGTVCPCCKVDFRQKIRLLAYFPPIAHGAQALQVTMGPLIMGCLLVWQYLKRRMQGKCGGELHSHIWKFISKAEARDKTGRIVQYGCRAIQGFMELLAPEHPLQTWRKTVAE
ncbi:unnamed protein product, partial [Prorocentrum cordatum]